MTQLNQAQNNCICPKTCDCQDFEEGLISNECPVHNDYPNPTRDCPVHWIVYIKS